MPMTASLSNQTQQTSAVDVSELVIGKEGSKLIEVLYTETSGKT